MDPYKTFFCFNKTLSNFVKPIDVPKIKKVNSIILFVGAPDSTIEENRSIELIIDNNIHSRFNIDLMMIIELNKNNTGRLFTYKM